MNYQEALQLLTTIGQEHILRFWQALDPVLQQHLLSQLDRLSIPTLLKQQQVLSTPHHAHHALKPFEEYALAGNTADIDMGKQLIKDGALGCLITAGGQGTRLRFDGPKGMFPITPLLHKTLFQLFAEKVKAASQQAQRPLYLAIMTSPKNHQETIEYFQANANFGLREEQLSFFCQSSLPFLDDQGHLLLERPYSIATGPDGNGGALASFFDSGIWHKWQAHGIHFVNMVLIDNPLAEPFDAELLGSMVRCQSEVAIKCVKKRVPEEKVGVLAKQNGQTVVVEYTEMNEKERTVKTSEGALRYGCANISLFCFSLEFIKKVAVDGLHMPLHKAYKAINVLDENNADQLKEVMAWKFEKFIFDVLPMAERVNALLYPREECFAPLKNFSGEDSIETVHQALIDRDARQLALLTGMPYEGKPLELSQAFYYPTPELLKKWAGKPWNEGGYLKD